MKASSLEEAINIIIENIYNSKIPIEDKTELLINLKHFLEPLEYEDNIRTLILRKEKKK